VERRNGIQGSVLIKDIGSFYCSAALEVLVSEKTGTQETQKGIFLWQEGEK